MIDNQEYDSSNLIKKIRQQILNVAHADSSYTCVLFASSGPGAIDSVISSVIPNGKKILILNNGPFGERLECIVKAYQVEYLTLNFPINTKPDLNCISYLLEENDDIYAIAMVHHETSTGLINPLNEIAELANKFGLILIVDALSSIAGIPIEVAKYHIDYLIGSSDICLQSLPGISFVICNKSELHLHEGKAKSFYFDLCAQNSALDKHNTLRFPVPIQIFVALEQALFKFFQEGQNKQTQRYKDKLALENKHLT